MIKTGNLRSGLPARPLPDEVVDLLVERSGLRIERIVSTGQATPEGQWYDQETNEWVLLVQGAAHLRIEGEEEDRARRRRLDPAPGPLPPSRDLDAGRAADGLARHTFSLTPR
jgi:hypothetical protein